MFNRKQYYQDNKEKILKCGEQWRKDNPEKCRKYRKQYYKDHWQDLIKYRYNLSYEDWLEMWERQDGRCAICKKPFNKKISHAHIDHDHDTGEIRGLLCKKCNAGIGFFDNDPRLITKIVNYLCKKSKGEKKEC